MFKKRDKKANLRRVQDEDEDHATVDAASNGESGLVIQTPMSTQKKKRKAPGSGDKKSTVLSFGGDVEDEGEGEAFQIKRSAHSRKAIQQFKSKGGRQSPDRNTYTQVSATGSYSKEAMEDLRSKSSLAPRVAETSAAATQDEPTNEQRKEEALAYAVSSALKSTEEGTIPSATLIHLARKNREKARKTAEFLPLDDNARATGGGKQSRMMRDDDNDDGEDGLEYLNFSDVSVSRQASRRQQRSEMEAAIGGCSSSSARNGNGACEEAMDDDEDGDAAIRRWEEQQMNSAASARLLGTAARVLEQQNRMEGLEPTAYGPSRFAPSSGSGGSRGGASPSAAAMRSQQPPPLMSQMTASQLPPLLSDVSSSSVLSSLLSKQGILADIVTSHDGKMSRTTEELHLSEKAVESLERQLMDTSEKYTFFKENTGYVADLLTCLDEKVNTLNILEDRVQKMWQELSKYLRERAKQDVDDEAQENRNGMTTAPVDSAHQMRVAEREGRRKRRRQHRQSCGVLAHDDGLSSDDELTESEKVTFSTEKESVVAESGKLFEDVADEFCDLKLIGQQFEMWKLAYQSSYDEAYIPICLAKLFAPFVRWEMLSWNPLEAGQVTGMEDTSWFKSLLLYSAGTGVQSQPDVSDDDTFLIPNLVEKVIITKLRGFVQHVWDPLSATQTARLVAVVGTIVSDYPCGSSGSRATEELLQSIYDRLKMAVDVYPYIPLFPKGVMENQHSRALQFFHRQYWSCFKLLRNCVQWQGIVSSAKLQQLCLDGLINRYLLRAIQHISQPYKCTEKCAKIIALLPAVWFTGKKRYTSLDGLAMLMSSKLPTLLYHATLGAPDVEKRKARSACQTLDQLLKQIGRVKDAAGMLEQFV